MFLHMAKMKNLPALSIDSGHSWSLVYFHKSENLLALKSFENQSGLVSDVHHIKLSKTIFHEVSLIFFLKSGRSNTFKVMRSNSLPSVFKVTVAQAQQY